MHITERHGELLAQVVNRHENEIRLYHGLSTDLENKSKLFQENQSIASRLAVNLEKMQLLYELPWDAKGIHGVGAELQKDPVYAFFHNIDEDMISAFVNTNMPEEEYVEKGNRNKHEYDIQKELVAGRITSYINNINSTLGQRGKAGKEDFGNINRQTYQNLCMFAISSGSFDEKINLMFDYLFDNGNTMFMSSIQDFSWELVDEVFE